MSSLFQISSGISNVLFVGEELKKAHTFIKEHGLPVPMEEKDFHKQMIQLERYAGSNYFEKALKNYKRINTITILLSVIILLVVGVIALVEYFSPELGVLQQIVQFMITQFALSMVILGGLFAAVIVLSIVRLVLAKNLHGKALEKAWSSIVSHVERK